MEAQLSFLVMLLVFIPIFYLIVRLIWSIIKWLDRH